MGANISMDTRAAIVEDASSSPLLLPMLTPPPPLHEPRSFEDKLRQESILIPEDLVDIHIDASDPATKPDTSDTQTEINAASDTPADNTRYGKGKHWKRNLKKKQSGSAAASGSAAQGGCAGETTTQQPTERTIEERRQQVRPIINKLTELQMNISYPAIRELYKQLNQFVKTGEDMKIKISFPEFSRRIKGELTNATYKQCWVKLEME
jgi:hypothetical protein